MKTIAAFLLASSLTLSAAAFSERDVTVVNHRDGVTLAGTLTAPDDGTPRAAIVLASGSGAENRDEEVVGHRPFKTIAEYLSDRGYAVLRLDDRGVGGSGGNSSESTTDNLARDMSAAITMLDSLYDKVPAGVLGHSEGGVTAVKCANADSLCRFIVTLAAPAWSGDSIVMSQTRAIAVALTGRWDEEATQRRLLDIVMSPTSDFIAKTLLRNELTARLGENAKMPQVAQQIEQSVSVMLSPAYRSLVRCNPEAAMRRVAVPWLALNGSRDTQVLPDNLKTIKEYNPQADTVLIDGHNHLFQPCITGLANEYASIAGDISDMTLEAIVTWLDKTTASLTQKP